MSRPVLLALFVAALLLRAETVSAQSRFAVLVGVGAYHPATAVEGMTSTPGGDGSIDLKSPPNDVALMSDVLSYYGFDDKNSLVLTDAKATRQAIIDAVRKNLLMLPAGSLAVFYFSGHGSALKGKDGQGEWIDETIVPHDGRIGGEAPRDIIDDEVYGWIDVLNRRAVTAVFIFDSCFSGGIGRISGVEKKALPAVVETSRRPNRDGVTSLRTSGVPGRAVVILTASEAQEPAQGVLTKGRYQGVFTTALRDSLLARDQALPPPVKWGDAMDRVVSALKPDPNERPVQSPRIYGARDAPIFDSKAPFTNSVAAKRVAPDRAVMAAGSDLGITQGSVFKLFKEGQIPWASSNVFEAKAKVAKVTANEAELEVLDNGKLGSDTLAAVEFEYAVPERRIKVSIPGPGQIDPFDRKAIVAGLGKFAEISDGPADLKVSLVKDQWRLATKDGKDVGGMIADGDTELLRSELGKRFADYARWMRLSDWKRAGTDGPKIEYRLSQATPAGPKLIEAADIAKAKITANASIQLLVENRGAQPIQVDALLLRPNFTIDVCPLGVLASRQELATEVVEMQAGQAAWKIVVSDPAQHLSLLFLKSESGARSAVASLEDEFARVWNGISAQSRSLATGQPLWKTLDVPFQVAASQQAPVAGSLPRRCIGLPQK